MIKLTTSGESHGRALVAILEGLPSNLEIDAEEILSGVRDRRTLGSPVCLMVENKDYRNWEEYMSPYGADVTKRRLTQVRPGHADLSGLLKYDHTDARNILERASARETAVRVAAGCAMKSIMRSRIWKKSMKTNCLCLTKYYVNAPKRASTR